ncbi:MAG TPA: DEAD/DEAH box helicase [Candidatus Kaiserbacteria bacterium]|nr:DEAD/DEAH box helicase [Candidatus Kaiserbacteria bacterium]
MNPTKSRSSQSFGRNSGRSYSHSRSSFSHSPSSHSPSSHGRAYGGFSAGKRPSASRGQGGYGGGRAGAGGARRGGGRSGGRKMSTFNPSQFINTNPVDRVEEVYEPKHRFDTFGLNEKLVQAITASGLEMPFPIQDQIIPEILKGNDVIGLAETGTGKTAAFLIPLIEKTLKEDNRQTLILTPTRELAIQIEGEFRKLARPFRLFSVTCVGGVNIYPQIKMLRKKNHFVIGTPGRILDLINRKIFDTSKVTTVVLDEADRMLDMGFINDIRSIVSATPKERETHFFSATITNDTKQLVNDFLHNPVMISVKKKDVSNSIAQDVVHFKQSAKFEKLLELLSNPDLKRVLIFGAMKHSVEKLAIQLSEHGIKAESIHGNKNHGQRQRALTKFKMGGVRVLVATDVAARGIHINDVTHVINYDLPNTFEDYVHRIGRTGRANKRGQALTFIPMR